MKVKRGAPPPTADLSGAVSAEADEGELQWKDRYETILRATGQVVYERDRAGEGMIFSGDVKSLLGYHESELDGGWPRWLQLIHPDDRELLDTLRRSAAPGRPFHLEYRLVRKDGKIASVRDNGCTVVDERTGKLRMVGVLLDISEQRDLVLQLQHAQKMEVFGRLAGGVAHDFNNLLTVFSGYTDMLLAEFSRTDPRHEYLEEMQRAVERASALTTQLLAFGRLQRSSPKMIHLGEILRDLGKMLRRLIGEDIELVISVAEGLGFVYADPRQIETVLINLVVNARDAMPHGGRLSIEASNTNIRSGDRRIQAGWMAGAYVQLAVEDTGIGIEEKLCSKIFEPFFTTKAPGQGTGLGLSTCYGIIEQSGGRIAVESIPGKGSVFRVYLPRVRQNASDLPEGRGAGAKPDAALPRGNGETILLVEDDLAVQKIYSTMLQRLGYSVICGSNGDEALRIAGQHPEIDIVITDLVMPLMSGTDLAEELRHILPNPKIVLISGYALEPVEIAGSDRHVLFLSKPLSRDTLACTLRELLESQ